MKEVIAKRIRRNPDQWQQLIDNQLASGLSAMAFCKEQHIGYASFCQWRKRLASSPDAKSVTDHGGQDFIDLSNLNRSDSSSWQIILKLGDGVELQLTRDRD